MSRPNQPLTFDDLVKLEPRLQALLDEAKAPAGRRGKRFCANAVFYGQGGLKERLVKLVGWSAGIVETVYPQTYLDRKREAERAGKVVFMTTEELAEVRHVRREVGVLGTSMAYDVAYDTIYAALPNCGEECDCL
jgi:hypothetical protein